MSLEKLAKFERKIRPVAARAMKDVSIKTYSLTRHWFLQKLINSTAPEYVPPKELERELWGIKFRSPLMNAAGMFKNGEGYELCHNQGAGAIMFGTTTAVPRKGNRKKGISLPFIPYEISGAASNCLGLPNYGDKEVADKIKKIKKKGMPIGASIALSPDIEVMKRRSEFFKGLKYYEDAGVDFIEINYSCPNTECSTGIYSTELMNFLAHTRDKFLDKRKRDLPVIVKFSNDTPVKDAGNIVERLIHYGYDGVNFGNTSVNYEKLREEIDSKERKQFEYFTKNYGGGVSGRPLKQSSLELCKVAVAEAKKNPEREFHVFRTGGINSIDDILASDKVGVSMNMWYTGYFEWFSRAGHVLYRELYKNYLNMLSPNSSK